MTHYVVTITCLWAGLYTYKLINLSTNKKTINLSSVKKQNKISYS